MFESPPLMCRRRRVRVLGRRSQKYDERRRRSLLRDDVRFRGIVHQRTKRIGRRARDERGERVGHQRHERKQHERKYSRDDGQRRHRG
jgi:hypothetical protein